MEKSKSVTQRHVIDLTFGVRAFNACWLSASFGISMLQMLLLAQGWRSSQNALMPACLASVWALGSLLGARLRGHARLWGSALVRGLVGLTVGLLVAWMLPASGGLLALACCLPLLALDAFLSGRAPLPTPGGVAARWMHRYWSTEGWPVQVERRGLIQS